MSLVRTTLSGACTALDTRVGLTSVTGVSNPVAPTGGGYTILLVDQEAMFVESVQSTVPGATVLRGQKGTQAVPHLANAPVLIGSPSDFPEFTPAQNVTVEAKPLRYMGTSAPVVSAATIDPTGNFFHMTGTTAVVTINLPAVGPMPAVPQTNPPTTDFQSGEITIVFDGSGAGLTWTAAGNISVAGTATTAGSSVTFHYDSSMPTPKWIPSRLS